MVPKDGTTARAISKLAKVALQNFLKASETLLSVQ